MKKQIKERGIIFNGEMVRAILDGRKTQTRHVMKLQPESNQHGMCVVTESGIKSEEGKFFWSEFNATGHKSRSPLFSCPFGRVGDRLWVRETFTGHYLDDDQIQDIKDGRDRAISLCEYRADYPNGSEAAEGWTPSSQMPRWASRITLEITDIRVERLQGISDRDAINEGLVKEKYDWRSSEFPLDNVAYRSSVKSERRYSSPVQCFQNVWESIYGQDSWQSNPFVWVVEFKRVEAA